MPLPPKWQFRWNRMKHRLGRAQGEVRQTQQAVMAEQRMCPACRALVSRSAHECPYCGQRLQASGPARRLARRAAPEIPVTVYLIMANVVMFLIEYALSGTSLLTNLMASPSPAATLRLGETLPIRYIVAYHQYWRWVTACFLHGGLLHIGMNMWALWVIGPVVDSLYGGAKYFTFYMLTGIIGYVVSGIVGFESLGASGAIFGLLGVLIAYAVKRRHTLAGQQLNSLAFQGIIWVVVISFIPGVDSAAHFGGIISGFLLGMLIGDDPPLTETQVRTWRALAWIMFGVVAASFYFMATAPML